MKEEIKFIVSLVLGLTVLSSGNAKNTSHNKTPTANHFSIQQNNPVEFLRGFFKWYRTKFEYLDHHIQYVDAGYKVGTPYRVNFHETERYLSNLKISGFFSDGYF